MQARHLCKDLRTSDGRGWGVSETIDILEYIANSPAEVDGGFHENTINAARGALSMIADLRAALAKAEAERDALKSNLDRAGLLRKDGTLRPPECYWDDDGSACESPKDDLDMSGDPGIVRKYRPAYVGRSEWWGSTRCTEEGMNCVGPFANEDAARAAVDAAGDLEVPHA